jgi:predicted MFS family arabinose efflux permease
LYRGRVTSIALAPAPGVRSLFATSIVARLPLAMLSIALLVHVHQVTGSYAAAGAVTGGYGLAVGVGAPVLGQIVDRRGQTLVLLGSASVAAGLLVVMALLPSKMPLGVLVGLAIGIGLATPPVGACLRTQLPTMVSNPGDLRSAYAIEASVAELTYIFGPPLGLCVGEVWSTGAALALGGVVLWIATAAFVAQPATRSWRPPPSRAPRERGGALSTPAMRTLVMVLFAVGVLLGADEVAVIAATRTLHASVAAAPLFAVWGAGSFAGGLFVARLGGGARTSAGLALLLGTLAVGHLALIPADGSLFSLGAVLLLAGATIAPTESSLYAMVDRVAPAGTVTEAFAWLATAIEVGSAAGAAVAGWSVDRGGPTAAFALAGTAGLVAVALTMVRSGTLVNMGQMSESIGSERAPAPCHPAARLRRSGRGPRV